MASLRVLPRLMPRPLACGFRGFRTKLPLLCSASSTEGSGVSGIISSLSGSSKKETSSEGGTSSSSSSKSTKRRGRRHTADTAESRKVAEAINALGKAGKWQEAFDYFNEVPKPNLFAYAAAIRACQHAKQPSHALDLMEAMCASQLRPIPKIYSELIARQLGWMHEPWRVVEELNMLAQQPAKTIDVLLLLAQKVAKARQMISTSSAKLLARVCVRAGRACDALDMIEEFSAGGASRAEVNVVYSQVLRSCATDPKQRHLSFMVLQRMLGDRLETLVAGDPNFTAAKGLLDLCIDQVKHSRPTHHAAKEAPTRLRVEESQEDAEGLAGKSARDDFGPGADEDAGLEARHVYLETGMALVDATVQLARLGDKEHVVDRVFWKRCLVFCHEAEQWQQLREVHEEMQRLGVENDSLTYSLVINAFEKLGDAVSALQIFEQLGVSSATSPPAGDACEGSEPETAQPSIHATPYHYCSVIVACGKAGMADRAMELFDSLKAMDGAKDPVHAPVFSAAIQACAFSGQWRRAVEIFMDLENRAAENDAFRPNIVSFNSVLDAVAPFYASSLSVAGQQGQQGQPASREDGFRQRQAFGQFLWESALKREVYGQKEIARWSANKRHCWIDLHHMSCGAAEMAVRWWVANLAPTLVAMDDSGARLPTICVVTGAGKTRPGHQTRNVREVIEELLISLRVPTITAMHNWRENAKFVKPSALGDRGHFDRMVAKQHEGAFFLDAEALVLTSRHDPDTARSWWVAEDAHGEDPSLSDGIATPT